MWADPDTLTEELADEWLDALGTAAAPAAVEPTAAEIDALRRSVAGRFPSGVAGAAQVVDFRRPTTRRLRRTGVAAAAAVILSASAAAASTGGVPVPRPLRAVAYALGLPVDSPALDDLHGHLDDLGEAVAAGDRDRAEMVAEKVHRGLARVPDEERDEARAEVAEALDAAETPAPQTDAEVEPPADNPSAATEPGDAQPEAATPETGADRSEPGPGDEPPAIEDAGSRPAVEHAEDEQDDDPEDQGAEQEAHLPLVEVEVHEP